MNATPVQQEPAPARYALSIGGKVYGPYRAEQMKTYIAEGRVSASSLVSRDGGPWMAASDDPFCAGLIGAAQPPPLPQPAATEARASSSAAREAFLKELQGVRLKTPAFASDAAAPLAGPVRPRPPEPIAEKPAETEQQSANYLIIFELKSRGHNRLEESIMSLGPAAQVMSGVWVLHSAMSAGGIRNHLVKYFGPSDQLFIVDASRDRTTWINLGPETDAHIRRVWRRT